MSTKQEETNRLFDGETYEDMLERSVKLARKRIAEAQVKREEKRLIKKFIMSYRIYVWKMRIITALFIIFAVLTGTILIRLWIEVL